MRLDSKKAPPRMPVKNENLENESMQKIMMRLPRSLAMEFQQTYLQLAALHLQKHGKKLYVQDCHIEMVRDWLEKQRRRLPDGA